MNPSRVDSIGFAVAQPQPLLGMPGSVRSIHTGESHGCAVRYALDGAYCWGGGLALKMGA